MTLSTTIDILARVSGATMTVSFASSATSVWPPGAADDTPIGVRVDIYVEIGIDFGGTQHHHIQIGRRRALGVWAGILCRRNLHMLRVLPDGFHCFQVKALHVLNRGKASGFQHSDDIAR